MNRLIEFRGKRLDNGEWAFGSYTNAFGYWINEFVAYEPKMYGNEIIEDAAEHYAEHEVDALTVGQFTELEDKNHCQIFDGDIGWDEHNDCTGVVVYDEGKFLYVCENISEDLRERAGDIEIVGNIHENKELLEGCAEE